MKTRVIEGVCAPVAGEDDNLLLFLEAAPRSLSATDLISEENRVPYQLAVAYEHADDPRFNKYIHGYERDTGRKSPPAYRIKITVEVEELSDDEAAEAWRSIQR